MKGASIKKIREQLEMTQTEFAALIGVHLQTIARWENHKSGPKKGSAAYKQLMQAKGAGRRDVGCAK